MSSTLARAASALHSTTFATLGLALGAVVGLTAGAILGFRLAVFLSTDGKHEPGCFTAYKPAQLDTGEPILVPIEVCSKEPGTRT